LPRVRQQQDEASQRQVGLSRLRSASAGQWGAHRRRLASNRRWPSASPGQRISRS